MLCITRKRGESITISGGIVVTILKSQHGKVQLGIDAPKDIAVCRTEIVPFWRGDKGQKPLDPDKAG